MLASEVIKRYEDFCPQEFSMEGDSRGRSRYSRKDGGRGH